MSPTADLGAFEFDAGDRLPLTVAYETYGEYDGSNAVLVCHALTGSHHVATGGDGSDDGTADGSGDGTADGSGDDAAGGSGDATEAPYDPAGQAGAWWDGVVGPGKPIDTERYFVVCPNVPGSCYGTTGPASTDPETGEPYGSAFPPVTVGDWTRAEARLLDELGVDRLHAVVGGSVGGMNVLDWARRYPDRVDRIVPVATGPRLGPQLLALNATARRAIVGDPAWNGGDYYGDGPDPDGGLEQARRIGHVTYLSAASMDRRFGRETAGAGSAGGSTAGGSPESGPQADGTGGADGAPPWAPDPAADPTHAHDGFAYREVASYLDYNAASFADRFDANSYLRLLRAMDEYDLAAGCGDDATALSDFEGEALVVSFTGDWHFPVERSRGLARSLRAAGVETTHEVVDSDYGHDAFLVEPETFARPLSRFLAGEDPAAPAADAGRAPVHSGLFR